MCDLLAGCSCFCAPGRVAGWVCPGVFPIWCSKAGADTGPMKTFFQFSCVGIVLYCNRQEHRDFLITLYIVPGLLSTQLHDSPTKIAELYANICETHQWLLTLYQKMTEHRLSAKCWTERVHLFKNGIQNYNKFEKCTHSFRALLTKRLNLTLPVTNL